MSPGWMPSRRILVIAALLLAAGLASWLLPARTLSPVEERTRSALANGTLRSLADTSTAPASVNAIAAKTSAANAFEPLPPLEAPLAQVYPRLVDEANRGNIHAACRLAYELQRCEMLPMRVKSLEQFKAKGPEAAEGRTAVGKGGVLLYLGPDGKTQVSIG